MLEKVEAGSDVVIASRYRAGARVKGLSWFRRLLSVGASIAFRMSLPVAGIRDYTCGYRAYRASLLKKVVESQGENF